MTTEYVNVYVLDAPLYADIPYTYYLPPELREQVAPGLFVTVPFGAANRHRAAVVAGFAAPPDEADTIKPVLAILNDRFSLSEELLGLCLFIKEHTLCTFGDAVKAALPAGGLMRQVETYTIWEEMEEKRRGVLMKKCDNTALFIYSYLEQKGSASAQRLRAEFGAATPDALATLLKEKLIRREYQLKGVHNESCTVYLSPAKEESVLRAIAEGSPDAIQKLRSPMQRALLAAVLDGGRQTDKALMERTGASRAQLNSLVQKGLLNSEKEAVWRDPYKEFKTVPPPPPVTLSEEQEAACATIRTLYETHEPKGVLLHGVTGSGKTQVMKAMIDTVIRDGRSVIILVPEIALTPQTVSIFCGYYGDRVAVMHSALSAGERSDAWLRIRDGQIDVVIGTRSAVFAPLPNLGMIILDEEQEHTYKSDMTPRYDAQLPLYAKRGAVAFGLCHPLPHLLLQGKERKIHLGGADQAIRPGALAHGHARGYAGGDQGGQHLRVQHGLGGGTPRDPRPGRAGHPVFEPTGLPQLHRLPRLRRGAGVPQLQRFLNLS